MIGEGSSAQVHDFERGDSHPPTAAEQALLEKTAWIEARRPKISKRSFKKEFSMMIDNQRSVDPKTIIEGYEDLVYEKDGKFYFPNFMVDFLLTEYIRVWAPSYNDWAGRGHIGKLRSILALDAEDPRDSKQQNGLAFTTPQRMRAEYRKEQIKRMPPKEAKLARQEDLKNDSKDLPRTITEVMALSGSDADTSRGESIAHAYVTKLRGKGYTEREIRERLQSETGALSRAFALQQNVSETEQASLAKKMGRVNQVFESAITETA